MMEKGYADVKRDDAPLISWLFNYLKKEYQKKVNNLIIHIDFI